MNLPPQDKLLHFVGGAAIAVLFGFLGHPFIGVAAAAVVGIGKELYDYQHPANHTADLWDFIATALGGLAGFLARIDLN